jgi:ABC-type sugar transport system ATPase subunit
MEAFARDKLNELGLMTIQNINQAVETLSGGQRQGVAVARAAAFGSKVIILDEPTAALGVKESRRVLELILDVRSRGIPIILISHNMPHVFEVADRIHIHRLGKRLCVINPKDYTMSDAVAFMTGAKEPPKSRLRPEGSRAAGRDNARRIAEGAIMRAADGQRFISRWRSARCWQVDVVRDADRGVQPPRADARRWSRWMAFTSTMRCLKLRGNGPQGRALHL